MAQICCILVKICKSCWETEFKNLTIWGNHGFLAGDGYGYYLQFKKLDIMLKHEQEK